MTTLANLDLLPVATYTVGADSILNTASDTGTRIEQVCHEFGAPLHIEEFTIGPRVVTYTGTLNSGVRYGDIARVVKEMAFELGVPSVRLERGTQARQVHLQVARLTPDVITLREAFDACGNTEHIQLPMVVGVDAMGGPMIVNLLAAPHMLVAGVTGSGKSTALTSMLTGLMLTKSPEEVELVLIDPKQVDLVPFGKAPHTRKMVAQTPADARTLLNEVITEMDFRFTELKHAQQPDLHNYNHWTQFNPGEEPMRYMVVVVDELASLVQSGDDGAAIESQLVRLAQLGRAAGIHLVCATQRPSAKVLSTQLRSQFPVRLSFRVTSAVDSRIILDAGGAEQLLGAGDGLLRSADGALTRLQGAYTAGVVRLVTDAATRWPAVVAHDEFPFNEDPAEVIEGMLLPPLISPRVMLYLRWIGFVVFIIGGLMLKDHYFGV